MKTKKTSQVENKSKSIYLPFHLLVVERTKKLYVVGIRFYKKISNPLHLLFV